jgi:hypothetical protein|tara:strand:+ start:376 stop:1107 length:732 start_codon:yes stop_codon:yes gene_type:complete
MVVAEILTGIALVQKSVEFIKSNISTANDIKDIANQIDGFFTGEAQMNKKQGKGMSIAEQFGSVENSATDFIDRKLLEEKRNELKQIINLRFGPTAWDEIISERATRIAEAKEAQRLRVIEARQQQKEFVDTLQTMGIIFCVIAVLVIGFVVALKAYAKGYTYQQKVNQGIIKEPKYTMCLRKKMVAFKNGLACIYQGAGKTFEIEFTDKSIGCPRKYKCVYNPNSKEPNIDDVMKSLKDAVK